MHSEQETRPGLCEFLSAVYMYTAVHYTRIHGTYRCTYWVLFSVIVDERWVVLFSSCCGGIAVRSEKPCCLCESAPRCRFKNYVLVAVVVLQFVLYVRIYTAPFFLFFFFLFSSFWPFRFLSWSELDVVEYTGTRCLGSVVSSDCRDPLWG